MLCYVVMARRRSSINSSLYSAISVVSIVSSTAGKVDESSGEATLFTVDGEVYPRSVDADVVAAVQEEHRALVPAGVRHPDVGQLDRRCADGPYAAIEGRVHARRVAVEQDEDGRLDAELAPRHDVLDVHATRVAHLHASTRSHSA